MKFSSSIVLGCSIISAAYVIVGNDTIAIWVFVIGLSLAYIYKEE